MSTYPTLNRNRYVWLGKFYLVNVAAETHQQRLLASLTTDPVPLVGDTVVAKH